MAKIVEAQHKYQIVVIDLTSHNTSFGSKKYGYTDEY